MSSIPAICEKCRTVFFSSGIEIPLGGKARIEESRMGPCPKCGGLGLIPSGMYSQVGAQTVFTPRSKADKRMLERAMGLVEEAVGGKLSPEEFQKEAASRVPELSALWKLLPANPQDAYQFWMLVLVALGTLLMAYQTFSDPGPPQITVPKEIIDAIQSARPDARDDSRKARHRRARQLEQWQKKKRK